MSDQSHNASGSGNTNGTDFPSEDSPSVFGSYQKPPDQLWTIPNDDERGVYRFILAAARRARQLQAGARPLISTTSRKPTKIAMDEIRKGTVEVQIIPEDQPLPPPAAELGIDLLGGTRSELRDRDRLGSSYFEGRGGLPGDFPPTSRR